jgi:hypothetical protein
MTTRAASADLQPVRYDKSISQFLPLSSITADDADRHYREVHTRFARNLLRAKQQVISYHVNRAVREYDLNGRWQQVPRAFRFVVLRFEPGRSLEFAEPVRDLIVADHRVFLRELRGFRVREDVVLDRLTGQTALQKYLFEYERRPGVSVAEGQEQFERMIGLVGAQAHDAFGIRQVLTSAVLSEGATEAVDEPGQRPLDRPLPETTKQGFLEFYFDQREWADEWFARPEVGQALSDPFWAVARGYRVEEECGLDRR